MIHVETIKGQKVVEVQGTNSVILSDLAHVINGVKYHLLMKENNLTNEQANTIMTGVFMESMMEDFDTKGDNDGDKD